MRSRPPVLSALVALVLATTAAAPAAAQNGDPFAPLPPAQDDPPVVVPTVADEDEGLQDWQQTLLIVGGVLFVVAIGVAIARDARRHAPDDGRRAGAGRAAEGFAGGPGSGAAPGRGGVKPQDRRRARAKARTARASRKKNR